MLKVRPRVIHLRATVARLPLLRGYKETSEHVTMESLGLDHPERVNYSASPFWTLRWLLPRHQVKSTDVFLEYGCGKGRVVLDAAQRYRFKRIVGVDLAPELTSVARELVENEKDHLRCRDITLATADATHFSVPDDVTFVYLYNPFGGATFERVCENLLASLDRAPRQMRIIYLNPVEERMLLATGRFRRVRQANTPKWVDRPGAAVYVTT